MWEIPWYATRKCCLTILYHALENRAGIRYTTHDGEVELNTIEYTTAFLNSDWLYFLWHGIKCHTNQTIMAMPDLHCRIHGTCSFLLKKSCKKWGTPLICLDSTPLHLPCNIHVAFFGFWCSLSSHPSVVMPSSLFSLYPILSLVQLYTQVVEYIAFSGMYNCIY